MAPTHYCTDCVREFGSDQGLQQHLRSPSHRVKCSDCGRSFASCEALQQHLDSPAHAPKHKCNECNKSFRDQNALQQHLNSPVHAPTYECSECNKSFKTQRSLEQHLDSLVHAPKYECSECNRSFGDQQALQQHLDSPVHTPRYECSECDRSFVHQQALQQHLDSSVHTPALGSKAQKTWSMFPSLHDNVAELLDEDDLVFYYFKRDESRCVEEYITNIMGTFICHNNRCASSGWESKVIPITIRMYANQHYNARVYHQRCKLCKKLSQPILDNSYAERVAYRLKKWSGIELENPPFDRFNSRPHRQDLCEGCRDGRCPQSRR